jgi:hypothetical protein
MNPIRAPAVALLVVGILGLVKTVWALAAPDGFKRFVGGWLKVVRHVNTLVGLVCLLGALTLWVCVLLGQSLVNWMVAALGGLMAFGASLYFRPDALEKALQTLVLNRGNLSVRLLAAAGLVFCLLLLWAGVRGL